VRGLRVLGSVGHICLPVGPREGEDPLVMSVVDTFREFMITWS
jgi:hypothetical protein